MISRQVSSENVATGAKNASTSRVLLAALLSRI